MEINSKIIHEIINSMGISPNKDLGQNFLVDPAVSKRISDAASVNANDKLLEVGGGLGSITHFLLESDADFDVVDLDERMCWFLENSYANSNIRIINNDIRKVDVSPYTKIVGNLPYYITTELITYLLLNSTKCEKMLFMIQSEAVERFVVKEGKEYGAISVLVHLLGSPKKLFAVKSGSFYPMPKCGSTVFQIELNGNIDREKALCVYKMAKQLFLNRRKTILNNLNNYLNNKDLAVKTLQNLNILETTRPEQLSPMQYVEIYDELNKNGNKGC